MSNPLRWFRQNSQILVVFLGIGAMAIFGLGPAFDVLSRSSTYAEKADNPTVATWSGGDLTRSKLDALRYGHYNVLRFQEGVQKAAMEQVGDEYRPLIAPIQPIRGGDSKAQTDNQLIDRLLLSEKAVKEGFVVSDAMIDEYIALLAGNAEFSRNDLEQINIKSNNRSASLAQVRRQLKLELLYRQMNVMARTGMPMIPNPMEAMEIHGKVTSRIECEVIPVAVSQFTADISEEPSNSDLRSLYREGMYNYPDLAAKKPGFKIGRELVAQYFMADYEAFSQNEMNKLSDADVQAEYDRLVEAGDDLVMEVVPDEVDEVKPPADDDEPAKADGQSINVRKSKSALVSYRPQEDGSEPIADAVDAVEQVVETAQEVITETTAPANEETPAVEEQAAPVEDAVSETTEPVVPATEAGEASEKANALADTEAVDVTPTEEAKPEVASVDEAKSEDPKSDDAKPAADDDEIGPLLGDLPKLNKQAKPLRAVADAIRRRMSQAPTQEAMKVAMEKAQSAVADYRMAYMSWKANSESGLSEDQPAPEFDYESIASEYNLIANQTPLVDDEAMSDEPLGKIMMLTNVATRTGQYQPQVVPVASYIFNEFEQLDKFEAESVQDFQTQSAYLFWLSDKREPRVPEFDECREQVVDFWKKQKALEMAQAEAQRLADSMNAKRGDLLSEVYPDQAFKTGEFTWFSNYGTPAISTVVGVSKPGDDFMRTAFGLERYGVSTCVNASRDTVYVVQRISEELGVEEVATDYMENQFFKFKTIPTQVRDTAAWYRRQMDLDWAEEFVKEMDYDMVSY